MAKIELPDKIFGRDVSEAYKRVEREREGQTPPGGNPAPDLKGFIYVPSVNLYFAEERSQQNLTWKDTHKTIISKGYEMPTPVETWELIDYLKGDLGNLRLRKVYDDILKTTPKDTWHGEWQNVIFSKEDEIMYVQKVIGIDGKGELVLSPKTTLEACLMQNSWADISKKTNLTSQGLCKIPSNLTSYSQGDNIYFWYPRENSVAGFDADSGGAGLDCDMGADISGSSLGVRLAARPKGASSKK